MSCRTPAPMILAVPATADSCTIAGGRFTVEM